MYGYEITQKVKDLSDGRILLTEGALYPALHRLEATGLIRGRWEQHSSGKKRRYYSLTEKGLEWLEAKVAEWWGFSSAVNMVTRPTVSQA